MLRTRRLSREPAGYWAAIDRNDWRIPARDGHLACLHYKYVPDGRRYLHHHRWMGQSFRY